MNTLRIRFCDFFERLPQARDYFRNLLSQQFHLDENSPPDFVLYSNYGKEHLHHECVRIFYSMENQRPDFRECDFALTFDFNEDSRHHRLPYYALHADLSPLVSPRQPLQSIVSQKSEFCAFVHSNPFGPERNRLLTQLSRYKAVVSGGRFRNNLGRQVNDKIEFMRSFKFAFAFENESYPGYTTEKLTDALLANTIPIYWGNERIAAEFNPKAFLCRHDFASNAEMIERIIEIDGSDELYREYIAQPAFRNDRLPDGIGDQSVLKFLRSAFVATNVPVARRQGAWSRRKQHFSPTAIAQRIRKTARHSIKGIRLATGI